jgi:hypothetical protein
MSDSVSKLLVRAVATAAILPVLAVSAFAFPTVWTGPTISFTKSSGADFTLPANQDQLTANVALTRASTQGMFNILKEAAFSSTSPADTLWATSINNPGDSIAATNWAALDFTIWTAAYGNSVGNNILNHNAVVHLVTDDVYLELQFTSFQSGGSGGGFAYLRSTPVPEPAALDLAILGLCTTLLRSLRRKN